MTKVIINTKASSRNVFISDIIMAKCSFVTYPFHRRVHCTGIDDFQEERYILERSQLIKKGAILILLPLPLEVINIILPYHIEIYSFERVAH